MTSDQLRIMFAVVLLLALLLLRLQAESFGAAEYDEPGNRYHRGFWTRLTWYALGLALLAAIYSIHPQPPRRPLPRRREPHRRLHLRAVPGRHRRRSGCAVRLVPIRLPAFAGAVGLSGAAINSIITAVIDEAPSGRSAGHAACRGLARCSSILIQTIIYVLATRMGAPGRHRYMLLLTLFIGVGCGWATVRTGASGRPSWLIP